MKQIKKSDNKGKKKKQKKQKKKKKKNSCENAYTLSRKRFSPVVVLNSANVSSSFTQQTNKQTRVKIRINKNVQT